MVLMCCLLPAIPAAAGMPAMPSWRSCPPLAVELVELDLADLDSVARLAGQLLGRAGGLDLLINNAGVMAVPRRQDHRPGV